LKWKIRDSNDPISQQQCDHPKAGVAVAFTPGRGPGPETTWCKASFPLVPCPLPFFGQFSDAPRPPFLQVGRGRERQKVRSHSTQLGSVQNAALSPTTQIEANGAHSLFGLGGHRVPPPLAICRGCEARRLYPPRLRRKAALGRRRS
jgi:hypothetical protein